MDDEKLSLTIALARRCERLLEQIKEAEHNIKIAEVSLEKKKSAAASLNAELVEARNKLLGVR